MYIMNIYILNIICVSEESPIHSQFITICFIRISPQSSDKHVDRNTEATSFAYHFCRTEMKIENSEKLSLH